MNHAKLFAAVRARVLNRLKLAFDRLEHIPDAKAVLFHAWSVRLWIAASAIILLEPLFELLVDLSDSWNIYTRACLRALAGIFGLLGIWARVVKQKELQDADK